MHDAVYVSFRPVLRLHIMLEELSADVTAIEGYLSEARDARLEAKEYETAGRIYG